MKYLSGEAPTCSTSSRRWSCPELPHAARLRSDWDEALRLKAPLRLVRPESGVTQIEQFRRAVGDQAQGQDGWVGLSGTTGLMASSLSVT